MPGGLGPFIPLIGGAEGNVFAKAATPSAVFTFTASAEKSLLPRSAAVSAVFTLTAAHASSYSKAATASAVFTVTASSGQTRTGAATALAVFHVAASVRPGGTLVGIAHVSAIFKCRSRGKRPGAKFGDGYLGRYQVGQDVPLFVQCVDSNGDPTVPDGSPVARFYREGLLVRAGEVPVETDPDAVGRFRGRYRLTDGDTPGHYAVVYRYGTFGLSRADSASFEVVAGGDNSGPVIAGYTFTRPDGDTFLSHLAAGRVATGQTPYLDEGI